MEPRTVPPAHIIYPSKSLSSTHLLPKMPRRSLSQSAKTMAANVRCLWKPAQSGKTRTIQQLIREDDGVRSHLNILICSNNRLLVAQTNARMTDDLYDEVGSVDEDGPADDAVVGGVYSWMSGTKKTNISSRDLAFRVLLGEVSMVVCCSHKKRFAYLMEMLDFLERVGFTKPVNVWIDEADVSVRHWSGDYDFSAHRCVREMTLVSATFDNIFDYYERIRVMPFPDTHPECYLGLRDCDLQPFDTEGRGAAAYVDAVLTAHPEMLKRGVKLFIPGDIERTTHDAIAKYLTARNCVVLVLNGVEKAFRFPDGRSVSIDVTLDEETPTELSRILADTYAAHKMDQYPFAVTGQLCLGRGITFQSLTFTFDYAVIPGIKDAASTYQCVARVLGNVLNFSPFSPTVFMSSPLLDKVLRQERIATNLAVLVHENEWADIGPLEVGIAAEDTADMMWSTEPVWQPTPNSPVESAEKRELALQTMRTFATALEAKAWGEANLTEKPSAMYPCGPQKEKTGPLTHYIVRGEPTSILPPRELLSKSGHLTAGQGKTADAVTGGPRCHPVLVDGQTRFLVVYKKFFAK